MKKDKVVEIVAEIYPKIENYYGFSKFKKTTPWIEIENSIYARYMEEEVDDSEGEEHPHAEYDFEENLIILYYPKIKSKKHLIKCLIHEYQHFLQSPSWMKRYYEIGYNYNTHPYEVAAIKAEKDWKLFT